MRQTRFQSRGMTLIEVMFAILILGMGSIMVAATMTVASLTTQNNLDDTKASNIAVGASSVLRSVGASALFTGTSGMVQPLTLAMRQAVQGNQIISDDPSYAWVGLYKRDPNSLYAQLFIIPVRAWNRGHYSSPLDTTGDPNDITGATPDLQPRGVRVTLRKGSQVGADTAQFTSGISPNALAVAEGTYFIIANDHAGGRYNGRIYRVGNRAPGDNTWFLSPGSDLQSPREAMSGAAAYLVGRAFHDPAHPDQGYDGPTQDLGIFTTMVALN